MEPKFQPINSSLPAEVHIGLDDYRKKLYTGEFRIPKDSSEKWTLDVIGLAAKYELLSLQGELLKQLNLTADLLCKLYHKNQENNLGSSCIQSLSEDMLTSPKLLMLPLDQMVSLMKQDTFYAKEINILKACRNYILKNEGADREQVLSVVRISNIPDEEREEAHRLLVEILGNKASNILEMNPYNPRLMPRISTIKQSPYLPRLIGLELVNTEDSQKNRKLLIKADGSIEVDDGVFKLYQDCALNYRLDMLCRLDQIQFDLKLNKDTADKITVGYSGLFRYLIDGSKDGSTWVRLVEKKDDFCQGLQNIYLEQIEIQFLRILGGGPSWVELVLNKLAPGLPSLNCSYCETSVRTRNDLLVPNFNVANEKEGATVYVNGVQDLTTKLLTSVPDDEKQDFPCIFRFILDAPDNFVEVVLAQQYMVDTVKFTLLDAEKSAYDYAVYVTPDHKVIPYNMRSWKATTNKKPYIGWKEIERRRVRNGMQTIQFPLQTVAAIRIECIGVITAMSNKDFGLIYFECSAYENLIEGLIR